MTATGATPVVGFTHLALTQFRNYRHLALDLDLRPVVLVGSNGAGKTNLLEALSLLGPGSGLNRAKLSEIDFRGAGNHANMAWAVHAKLQCLGGDFALGTGRDPLAQARGGPRWPGARWGATGAARASTVRRRARRPISPTSCRCSGWCRRWTGRST